jgi:hypothetical protein
MESYGGMILTGENRITWIKTYLSATLFTTNLTWTDLDVNPGLSGERPETIHLTQGMATAAYVTFIEKYKYKN